MLREKEKDKPRHVVTQDSIQWGANTSAPPSWADLGGPKAINDLIKLLKLAHIL